MKREDLTFQTGFRVSVDNERSQGAVMVLAKGGREGGPDNRHKGADQWLVVISGTGGATIHGRKIPLRAGSMVLIERGDTHEIRNTGRSLLRTVSVYVHPPIRLRVMNCRRAKRARPEPSLSGRGGVPRGPCSPRARIGI